MSDPTSAADPIARLNAALQGRYAIEREVGEGGMATVYLAADLRHERNVALKVLKPELAAVVGAERFLAEIKTTAALQHPNILPLHDSGEAGSFLFYVMPYVEGESLRDRLDREHQLPIDDAVQIARNLAEALHYAHGKGVIHRDIKPANILLQAGKPVIADFGIALAVGAAGGGRLTETGVSVGTPHYMSPEQATGDQSVGVATDTYALGCVLYEMLAGEPPYTGTTAQAILGKIIAGEPASATKHRSSVPANVDAAVRRSLEKLPADRFRSAQEFANALSDPGFRYGQPAGVTAAVGAGPWNRLAVALASLAGILAAALGWSLLRPDPPRAVTRVSVSVPSDQLYASAETRSLDLSASGSLLAYSGEDGDGVRQLVLRGLDALRANQLPIPEGARGWALSPDGREVATTVGAFSLRVVPLDGGAGRTVVADSVTCCVRWGPEGEWLYYTNRMRGLSRVPARGGSPEVLTTVDSLDLDNLWLDVLPGGKTGVFQASSLFGVDSRIMALDLDSREVKELVLGRFPRFAGGYLFHTDSDGTTLTAIPFDSRRMAPDGPPIPVVEGMPPALNVSEVQSPYAISSSGTLTYFAGNRAVRRMPMWVDRDGQRQPIDSAFRGPFDYPRLSPDGTKLAVSGGGAVFVKDMDDGPLTRLTFDGTVNYRPSWSPDGIAVLYASNRMGPTATDLAMYSVRPDGVGGPVRVGPESPSATLSRDGAWWIYRTTNLVADLGNIMAVRTGSDSEPIALVETPFQEAQATLSPDGRWFAYSSPRSGTREVYVRPFPEANEEIQISNGGGHSPVWGHLGRELFYLDGSDMLVAARYRASPSFGIESQGPLFDASVYFTGSTITPAGYDVTRDDQRFVMIGEDEAPDSGFELILVQNLFEELKERTGGND